MVFVGAFSAAALGAFGIVHTPCAAAQEAAPAADADGKSRVSQLVEDGSQSYRARDYRHALEKFVLAYTSTPDPNLLFNIARCYEALGDTDVAIDKYEAFLAAQRTDALDAQRTDALDAQRTDALDEQRARDALKRLHTPVDTGHAEVGKAVNSEAEARAQAAPAPKDRDSSGQRASAPQTALASATGGFRGIDRQPSLLPWLTLGAGAASAGFGGIMYMLGTANQTKGSNGAGYNDTSRAAAIAERSARDQLDSGTRKKAIGGVGLGIGGALLATSIVLLATGNSGKNKERGVALRVSPGTSGGSVALRGCF